MTGIWFIWMTQKPAGLSTVRVKIWDLSMTQKVKIFQEVSQVGHSQEFSLADNQQ